MVIASDCLESILGQREKAIFKYGYYMFIAKILCVNPKK